MRAPVEAEPEVAPPVEDPPAAVQEVAFVELHVRVDDCPLVMVLGETERYAMGVLLGVVQLLPFHTSGEVQVVHVG